MTKPGGPFDEVVDPDDADALFDALLATDEAPPRAEMITAVDSTVEELALAEKLEREQAMRATPPKASAKSVPPGATAARTGGGGLKLPRPGAGRAASPPSVVTAKPPSVNPAGPSRREPFPLAQSAEPPEVASDPEFESLGAPLSEPPAPATPRARVSRPAYDDDDIPAVLSQFPPPPGASESPTAPPLSVDVPTEGSTTTTDAPPHDDRQESEPLELASMADVLDDTEDILDFEEFDSVSPGASDAATPSVPPPVTSPGPSSPPGVHPTAVTSAAEDITADEFDALAALEEGDAVDVGASSERPEVPAAGETGQDFADADLSAEELAELAELEAAEGETEGAPGAPSAELPPEIGGETEASALLLANGSHWWWLDRAARFEALAAAAADADERARLLLTASELRAITGQVDAALDLAQTAAKLVPTSAVAARQLRLLVEGSGDAKQAATLLVAEARSAPTPAARAHASHLGADIERLDLDDAGAARRKADLAARADPGDARTPLLQVLAALAPESKSLKVTLGDAPDLALLDRALSDIGALRGTLPTAGTPVADPVAAFVDATRALSRGDRRTTLDRLDVLAGVEGLAEAARWLGASLAAPEAELRPRAITALETLLEEGDSAVARRALAARALEAGRPDSMERATAPMAGDEVDVREAFAAVDRLVLAVLAGAAPETLLQACGALPDGAELQTLSAAVGLAAGLDRDLATGDAATDAQLLVARRLEKPGGIDLDAIDALGAPELSRLFRLERPGADTSSVLGSWPGAAAEAAKMASAMLAHAAGDAAAAQAAFLECVSDDTPNEAAVRQLLAAGGPEYAARILVSLADAFEEDPTRRALLLTEAALRLGLERAEAVTELVEGAVAANPDLPFAYRQAELLARSRGDVAALSDWFSRRMAVGADDLERSHDALRGALILAGTAPADAAALLGPSVRALEDDIALQELFERLAPGADESRGRWREAAAEAASEPRVKLRYWLDAAGEYESAAALADATRVAEQAMKVAPDGFARLTFERLASTGSRAAELTGAIMERAKAESDPVAQRELYERLADLDIARGEHASALLWQTAILETHPTWLPSLRRVEQAYLGAGRITDVEPIERALAACLPVASRAPAAALAARLVASGEGVIATADIIEHAAGDEAVPYWVLRDRAMLGRVIPNDEMALSAYAALADVAPRPVEAATLNLRAADAAVRLTRWDAAEDRLGKVLEVVPDHLVALTMLADVCLVKKEPARAADLHESVARASRVTDHQRDEYLLAARLWLDEVKDAGRAVSALEQAAALDPGHDEVFELLQGAYVEAGERKKLAGLIEGRLALTTDPDERVRLEVVRGRALADVGDRVAARAALAAAIEANPEHADALEAYGSLSAAEEDWEAAEQSWIRLARIVQEPEPQAEVYRRLADLYETRLPNPQRAELSYKEVLRRLPSDLGATEGLVRVYTELRDAQKALELATALVKRAETTETKRERMIALSRVYEDAAGDLKRAEAMLQQARKAWPLDDVILRALAELHERAGDRPSAKMLLDRAAKDARRALGTGRFEPALFGILTTVAELRGATDAAAIARSTLAAIEGRDSALSGTGASAGNSALDDALAPDILAPPLRALLRKAGDALDRAMPLDLRALKAAPAPQELAAVVGQVKSVASAFGLNGVEVYVSPSIGLACMPDGATPARLILGKELLEHPDGAAREFALLRCLKIMQAHASALSRVAPVELLPTVMGWLQAMVPSIPVQGDAQKAAAVAEAIKPLLPPRLDDETLALAYEVSGSIGNRASQLGTAIRQLGNRAALLGIGDPGAALRGLAAASDAELPAEGAERLKWIVRNPEARDLAVFSVSEEYAQARRRATS